MKITFRLLLISSAFFIITSCSKDDDKHRILGTWKLTTWTVDIPFDLDNDMVSSSNFLDKTACAVSETLIFDNNGIVTANDTFNPEIIISLKDDTSGVYDVEEICAEGTIGFSVSYVKVNSQSVEFNNTVAVLSDKRLTIVYENAVKIYNESLTEVIEKKDLTLVYSKK